MTDEQQSPMLTLADLDSLIDAVRARDASTGADAFEYFLVSPAYYRRLMWTYRRAQKRHWQLSQKWRAETRRTHRERKRQHAALAAQFRAR